MLKVALVTSAIVLTGLVANSVEACEGHDAKPKDRESQLAHAFIEGHPRSAVQKQIAALTGGKTVTGTIYNTDGSVDVKRTAQMLVTTNGKDPKTTLSWCLVLAHHHLTGLTNLTHSNQPQCLTALGFSGYNQSALEATC